MRVPQRKEDTFPRDVAAGVLSWLLPGAGHWLLGHRALAVVFFVAITFPYALGLALGGIKNSVNPWSSRLLFVGEMGAGGYTLAALAVNQTVLNDLPSELVPALLAGGDAPALRGMSESRKAELQQKVTRYVSFYPESDVAQIYLSTAGLLNILVIIDAVARSMSGLPTYARDLPSADPAPVQA